MAIRYNDQLFPVLFLPDQSRSYGYKIAPNLNILKGNDQSEVSRDLNLDRDPKTQNPCLWMEMIIVCFYENLTKHKNKLCGQNVEFLNAECGGTYSKSWALNGPSMNNFRHNCPVSLTLELFFLHIMSWFQRDTHRSLLLSLIQIWKIMWHFVHRVIFYKIWWSNWALYLLWLKYPLKIRASETGEEGTKLLGLLESSLHHYMNISFEERVPAL
jgi:hypothetical protein